MWVATAMIAVFVVILGDAPVLLLGGLLPACAGSVLLLVFASFLEPKRIGLLTNGVIVDRRVFGRLFLPWGSLTPRFASRYGSRVLVDYYPRENSSAHSQLVLTAEQGRALATSPSAPPWDLPMETRVRWGIGPGADEPIPPKQ
jgi:hypothetical protein